MQIQYSQQDIIQRRLCCARTAEATTTLFTYSPVSSNSYLRDGTFTTTWLRKALSTTNHMPPETPPETEYGNDVTKSTKRLLNLAVRRQFKPK